MKATGINWESNLCVYDERHPDWNDMHGYCDPADVPEPRTDCSCDNCFYGRDALAVAHLAQVALSRQGGEAGREWVSVEDRLPKNESEVWIVVRGVQRKYKAKYFAETGEYHGEFYAGGVPYNGVTHWCQRNVDTPPPFQQSGEGEG